MFSETRPNAKPETAESYVAGSFVKYLIKEYGTEMFGELWNSAVSDSEPQFEKIYGKKLSQIGNEYINNLK